ncbi:hypothetical protein QOT17_011781 [Balamuthia mandrillaris]
MMHAACNLLLSTLSFFAVASASSSSFTVNKLHHVLPHIDARLHPVPHDFDPTNTSYLQSIGMLAVPGAVLAILVALLSLLYVTARFCSCKSSHRPKRRNATTPVDCFWLVSITLALLFVIGVSVATWTITSNVHDAVQSALTPAHDLVDRANEAVDVVDGLVTSGMRGVQQLQQLNHTLIAVHKILSELERDATVFKAAFHVLPDVESLVGDLDSLLMKKVKDSPVVYPSILHGLEGISQCLAQLPNMSKVEEELTILNATVKLNHFLDFEGLFSTTQQLRQAFAQAEVMVEGCATDVKRFQANMLEQLHPSTQRFIDLILLDYPRPAYPPYLLSLAEHIKEKHLSFGEEEVEKETSFDMLTDLVNLVYGIRTWRRNNKETAEISTKLKAELDNLRQQLRRPIPIPQYADELAEQLVALEDTSSLEEGVDDIRDSLKEYQSMFEFPPNARDSLEKWETTTEKVAASSVLLGDTMEGVNHILPIWEGRLLRFELLWFVYMSVFSGWLVLALVCVIASPKRPHLMGM